jgi:AcrR family transcriptional regulator
LKLAQNKKTQEDLRVRRTRKLLHQALIELTVEKGGFNDITIQDLTERAMINRSTFYRHYLDKCALVNDYMDEVHTITSSEDFTDGKLTVRHKPGEPPEGLINFVKHIQCYADFYRIMLGPNGDPGFTQHFRQNTEKNFHLLFEHQFFKIDPNGPPASLKIKQISHACVGAVLWWLENDQPCPPEKLAAWMSQTSMSLVGPAVRQYLEEAKS